MNGKRENLRQGFTRNGPAARALQRAWSLATNITAQTVDHYYFRYPYSILGAVHTWSPRTSAWILAQNGVVLTPAVHSYSLSPYQTPF